MANEWNEKLEDELAADISFAIGQSSLIKKVRPTPMRALDDPRYHLARQIVRQIKLSNWRIERGPPLPHHSIGVSMPEKD